VVADAKDKDTLISLGLAKIDVVVVTTVGEPLCLQEGELETRNEH